MKERHHASLRVRLTGQFTKLKDIKANDTGTFRGHPWHDCPERQVHRNTDVNSENQAPGLGPSPVTECRKDAQLVLWQRADLLGPRRCQSTA